MVDSLLPEETEENHEDLSRYRPHTAIKIAYTTSDYVAPNDEMNSKK
jgi:hypothetical protein